MTIYSHSRISTFEQCPRKFKFKYIDKLKPDIEQTIEGFLGNKVHETLEWIYKEVLNKKEVSLDKAIKFFLTKWKEGINPRIKIIKSEFNYEYYLQKGIKFITNYFKNHYPFKDNTIALEKKIFVNLDEKGFYKLQGYIDRLVYNKDKKEIEIHDYKTSSFLKTQEELDKDRQLALYSIGIQEEFEEVKEVKLIWHFLNFDKKIISKRTNEELENLKRETLNKIKEIESTKEFPPKPSKLCKWCEFRSYCDLFNRYHNSTPKTLESGDNK